jgi:hypothetical protein
MKFATDGKFAHAKVDSRELVRNHAAMKFVTGDKFARAIGPSGPETRALVA